MDGETGDMGFGPVLSHLGKSCPSALTVVLLDWRGCCPYNQDTDYVVASGVQFFRATLMTHFIEPYADQVNKILHYALAPTWFYKQEVFVVPGLVTALLITYDGERDDSREILDACPWDQFVKRITNVDPDWDCDPDFMREVEKTKPEFMMGGWLRRTLHLIRAGQNPEQWTVQKATQDITTLLSATAKTSPTFNTSRS